LFIKPLLGGRG